MARFEERAIELVTPFGGLVPPSVVRAALRAIEPAAKSSALMAIEGRGRVAVRSSPWIRAVSDIRFRAASPRGDKMILEFTAPRLGDAAPDLYRQRDFWREPPPEDSTVLDFLAEAIRDVSREKRDSDLYDSNVLSDFRRFNQLFHVADTSLNIPGPDATVVLDETFSIHVSALTNSMPEALQVRVVGRLDMLRASTQSFGILLDDKTEIPCFLDDTDISELQPLFQKDVLITGRLIFRPSGRPLRIESSHVSLAGAQSEIWRKLPTPSLKTLRKADFRKAQNPGTGLPKVLGAWPGEELDNEINDALEMIS